MGRDVVKLRSWLRLCFRIPVRGFTVGVAVSLALLPLVDTVASLSHRAPSYPGTASAQSLGLFSIVSPLDAAVVGDGNLIQIEGVAHDRLDGVIDRIEVAFNADETWAPAQRVASDPTRWTYLWSDPAPGRYLIRARAAGIEQFGEVEQSITVEVKDVATTRFVIENPYAAPGVFRKGAVHVHSTNSFDGWTSLPPAELALEHKRKGYQFLAITDHDVISYPREVTDGSFLVIPGYESTADSGHITGLWASDPVSPALPPQQRIDHITNQGGMAILNHPGWQVGWSGTDFTTLSGYFAFEIFNGITSTDVRAERNAQQWHQVLNAKGWANRTWAVAVDDAHEVGGIGRGWIMAKAAQLTDAAVRQALVRGAFYASNGPSFSVLGVQKGAIAAASPDAETVRFLDQDMQIVSEGPASGAICRPQGTERWIRVEAITSDGRTAWSQPFWLKPNFPRATLTTGEAGAAIVGETLPGARLHVSEDGSYLGNVVANAGGAYTFRLPTARVGRHEIRIVATAPKDGGLEGPATLLERTAPAPG